MSDTGTTGASIPDGEYIISVDPAFDDATATVVAIRNLRHVIRQVDPYRASCERRLCDLRESIRLLTKVKLPRAPLPPIPQYVSPAVTLEPGKNPVITRARHAAARRDARRRRRTRWLAELRA